MVSPIILANGAGGPGIADAARALLEERSALDVVEQGIRQVEIDTSVRTVGRGGAPNLLGEVECDASIMCGKTLKCGAVGALRDYVHAITVARQVMERTPHTMLVGEGAALFAGEIGEQPTNMLTARAREDYERWLSSHVPEEVLLQWPNVPLSPYAWESAKPSTAKGTTCFLVRTSDSNLAGGVSTSGWAYKYPGRLGDSPIIGAGLFVDNKWGACACTHTGEIEPPIFWLWRSEDTKDIQCLKADFCDLNRGAGD